MTGETQPGAQATFPDGHIETWTAGSGVNLSGEALAEFMRVCFKPTPTEVEIVQVPIEPMRKDVSSSSEG